MWLKKKTQFFAVSGKQFLPFNKLPNLRFTAARADGFQKIITGSQVSNI